MLFFVIGHACISTSNRRENGVVRGGGEGRQRRGRDGEGEGEVVLCQLLGSSMDICL